MHTYICTYTTLHYTTLHYIIYTFYYIVLGYATLDYIALPCIALHLRFTNAQAHIQKDPMEPLQKIWGSADQWWGQTMQVPGVFSRLRKTFGTLDRSVVELYMAMTGVTDWVVQYEVPRVRRVRMRVADVETFHLFCHRTKVTKCTLRYNGKSLINGGFHGKIIYKL